MKKHPTRQSTKTHIVRQVVLLPRPQEIAMRAHEIFLARGGTPGLELDDWLQAERELKAAASQRAEPHPVGTGETGPGQA